MDIRTKLIFACVAISLASMLLMGFFLQRTSVDSLGQLSARQIDALASARLEDIQIIRQSWREQAYLITSRTSLRELVASHPDDPETVVPAVQRILDDARGSVTIFRRITAFDRDGNIVATSGDAETVPPAPQELAGGELEITGFAPTRTRGLDAIAHAALDLRGNPVGQLEAVVDTRRLLDITRNYHGLGETGEMYLVAEFVPGQITVLNPLRASDGPARLARDSASEPMLAALSGTDATLRGATDYRGERTWAATRRLPGIPVGLVVKIDEREMLQPHRELRARFFRTLKSVAALAILIGALLGTWLARPIRRLHETIRSIRAGNRGLRATVTGEDEVSFLAESFNELMDHHQKDRP